MRKLFTAAASLIIALAGTAQAWDAAGHRAICWLALDGLSPDTPAFLKDKEIVHAVGWQAAEPDRWRSQRSNYLMHENAPDHYIDVEDLQLYGLTLTTVPPLRMQYVAAMAVARHEHPEGIKPYNAKLDPAAQSEWPGFLPHAIMEHQAKLAASFKTLRILEALKDPARGPQMEMAKRNIMVEMGILAHFVGDAAQPLHTTRHHHGWVGDNPKGYTTDKGIHAYIDGRGIKNFKINYAMLKPTQKYDAKVNAADPWNDVIIYIQRSYDQVVPLYELKKSGDIDKDAGKAFITERLQDAGAMLAALYNSAWEASKPTPKDLKDFPRYDAFRPGDVPGAPPDNSPDVPDEPDPEETKPATPATPASPAPMPAPTPVPAPAADPSHPAPQAAKP